MIARRLIEQFQDDIELLFSDFIQKIRRSDIVVNS